MFSFAHNTEIGRPVPEVFAYVSDPRNVPRWRPDVLEVCGAEQPLSAGSTFSETVAFLGTKRFDMVVREWLPDRRVVIETVRGPGVRPTQRLDVVPTPGGTRISIAVDAATSGVFRLMEPLLRDQLRKKWVGYLENVRRDVEAQHAAGA